MSIKFLLLFFLTGGVSLNLVSIFLFFLFQASVSAAEVQEQRIGFYKILIDRPNDQFEGRIRIFYKKKLVFEEREFGSYYYIGNKFDNSLKGKDPFLGKDLNGNSIPDLIITQWTGGGHCCNYLTIFELGKVLRKLVTVSGGSSGFRIVDLDGDKISEIEFWDWPIDYAFTSFSDSAQGRTVLKFVDSKYQVSQKLMTTKIPSLKKIKKIINKLKIAFYRENQEIPFEFLNTMMELSYTGHLELALKIADETWPTQKSGLTEFKIKFKKLLNESSYWREFVNK